MLVAPLDWGLGHATRCIPIIRCFISSGCKVIIASSGSQLDLLKTEFPDLAFLDLPGYQVSYAKTSWRTITLLILKIPRILAAIRREHQWLKETTRQHKIDLVISDNRYGLFSKATPSIFITHQLLIKTSFFSLADRLLQRMNYHLINRFSACWIPDNEGENNFGGELSHPLQLPRVPISYLGGLSRFEGASGKKENKHILVVLSGPEPQRSIFEKLVLQQAESLQETLILVRGLPIKAAAVSIKNPLITLYNYLGSSSLCDLVLQSRLVICRSGYSSIMDLLPLNVACAFVPTPGQPEQQYLGRYLTSKGACLCYSQASFNLQQVIDDARQFTPKGEFQITGEYREVIRKTLNAHG